MDVVKPCQESCATRESFKQKLTVLTTENSNDKMTSLKDGSL